MFQPAIDAATVIQCANNMRNPLKLARRCVPKTASTRGSRTTALDGTTHENSAIAKPLTKLHNPTARLLAEKIVNKTNAYIRTATCSPLHEAINRGKSQHPHHVIAIWNGNSYDVHGADAAVCVEHCGLKPTGLTPHVEISVEQIHAVVRDLHRQGIKVAIYNCVTGLESCANEEPPLLKKSLIFSHEATENDDHPSMLAASAANHNSKVAVGITHNRQGYSLSIIYPATCVMDIRERLTPPAAVALLHSIDSRVILFHNGNSHVKKLLTYLPTVIHYEPIQGRVDAEMFHEAACANIKQRLNITNKFKVNKTNNHQTRGDVLDKETATSLGLCCENVECPSKSMPLHLQMLPDEAPQHMKQYMMFLFTRMLTHDSAENVRYVSNKLADLPVALLDIKPVVPSKVRAVLSQKKVDLTQIIEIYQTLDAFMYYTEALPRGITRRIYSITLSDLDTNLKIEQSKRDAHECREIIGSAVTLDTNETEIPVTGISCIDNLFKLMESYINSINRNLLICERDHVDEAACELLNTIASDYIGIHLPTTDTVKSDHRRENISDLLNKHMESNPNVKTDIVMNDHFIWTRDTNGIIDHTKLRTIETVIGNEKVICHYSKNVIDALINYRNKCSLAETKTNKVMASVRKSLAPHSQGIIVISHFVVVLQTLTTHVGMALAKGWTMPAITNGHEIVLKNLIPQHIDPDEVLPMSVHLKGVHVLPSQNNSGRTTCIKAVLSSCLAANLGLYVPCSSGSKVPRFTRFMYHSPTGHSNTEAMCPSKYSMHTIENILDTADKDTLVLIDNLGSNLEVTQGTALVSFVIKRLLNVGSRAIISTNLSGVRRELIQGAYFNMLVANNETMELGDILQKPALFTDVFPNNQFVKKVQEYIHHYYCNEHPELGEQTSNTYVGTSVAPGPNDSTDDTIKKARCDSIIERMPLNLHAAASTVISVIEKLSLGAVKNDVVHIFENGVPPPMLNNAPVLYVALVPIRSTETAKLCLETSRTNQYDSGKASGTAVYVGETGNLVGRLKSHRKKPQSTVEEYLGKAYMNHEPEMTSYLRSKNQIESPNVAEVLRWNEAHFLAVKMPSRIDAKIYERKVIKGLYRHQNDVILLSYRDGIFREIAPLD